MVWRGQESAGVAPLMTAKAREFANLRARLADAFLEELIVDCDISDRAVDLAWDIADSIESKIIDKLIAARLELCR